MDLEKLTVEAHIQELEQKLANEKKFLQQLDSYPKKCLCCGNTILDNHYSRINIHCDFYSGYDGREFFGFMCNCCISKAVTEKLFFASRETDIWDAENLRPWEPLE